MTSAAALTGHRFGRLVALTRAGSTSSGHAVWICRCDCGSKTLVSATNLKHGSTYSCGCLRKERGRRMLRVHGHTGSAEHAAWMSMRTRCSDAARGRLRRDYYDRGIRVCASWQLSFESFLSDMGTRPSPQHSLDRIDNEKGYEPKNCRWATKREQAQNRRNTRLVTVGGRMVALSEAARILGVSVNGLGCRIRRGQSIDAAVAALKSALGERKDRWL